MNRPICIIRDPFHAPSATSSNMHAPGSLGRAALQQPISPFENGSGTNAQNGDAERYTAEAEPGCEEAQIGAISAAFPEHFHFICTRQFSRDEA